MFLTVAIAQRQWILGFSKYPDINKSSFQSTIIKNVLVANKL